MRIILRPEERRPSPPPLATDDRRAISVGIAAWVVALAATLVLREELTALDETWWTWTCVVGIVLGLLGFVVVHRRDAGRTGAADRDGDAARDESDDPHRST